MKYYRSLNSILSKIETKSSIDVTLSLVSSFSSPVLLYGLESCSLSVSQIEKLAHPFNSVYTKLFSTFDKNVISLCQFYTGYLPLQYMLDLRMIRFFDALCVLPNEESPAKLLFKWFGEGEYNAVCNKHNIVATDSYNACKRKVWCSFETLCNV